MGVKTFEYMSEVSASPEVCWRWISSVDGIRSELMPYLNMTFPSHVKSIEDFGAPLGTPLCKSWILLFGFIPIDFSKLTLLELEEGIGFVEQSPMGSMKTWRHERSVMPMNVGSRISDRLTFEPKFASSIARVGISALFKHRHAIIKRRLSAP